MEENGSLKKYWIPLLSVVVLLFVHQFVAYTGSRKFFEAINAEDFGRHYQILFTMLFEIAAVLLVVVLFLLLDKAIYKGRSRVVTNKKTVFSLSSIAIVWGISIAAYAGATLLSAEILAPVNDFLTSLDRSLLHVFTGIRSSLGLYRYAFSGGLLEESATGYLLFIALTSVLFPVLEEIKFRGIYQLRLLRGYPVWMAIGIQSIAFTLYHPNITLLFLLAGAMFGAIAWHYKSILLCVIIHVFSNLFANTYWFLYHVGITEDREEAGFIKIVASVSALLIFTTIILIGMHKRKTLAPAMATIKNRCRKLLRMSQTRVLNEKS